VDHRRRVAGSESDHAGVVYLAKEQEGATVLYLWIWLYKYAPCAHEPGTMTVPNLQRVVRNQRIKEEDVNERAKESLERAERRRAST
jgi:hypothetical protein